MKENQYGLIGYILKNTLSDYGGVTRGICKIRNNSLVGIDETKNIVKTSNGAVADGRVIDVESICFYELLVLSNRVS